MRSNVVTYTFSSDLIKFITFSYKIVALLIEMVSVMSSYAVISYFGKNNLISW